ncbi:hypothetical protein GDO78_009824 [Eleutherodactylus coqui]|uniref:Cochlin n=1 Tax=Eleutherodactylus coqui TaxID=57060 RepID=A0A8J6FAM4_ELECQ|nr:hypothetical protein GDO78_009824 [Eleutherodactylus coqui]
MEKKDVPHIDCDIKAGKIVNPEFLAKCPASCQDGKHRVYGTDIYASFSSICTAAIHSGVIDNSGGKILVRKVAGQSGYKGSFSNGIRSLSLPRWKESFVIAGKAKKGVTYPTVLEYVEVKVETVQREVPPPTVATTTQPTTLITIPTTFTTTPEPTTPQPTTVKPTTTTTTTPTTTTTARTRPPLVRARDTAASNIHPAYSSIIAASSIVRSPTTYSSSRQIQRSNPVPERSNVAPNTGQSYSSDTRDSQVSNPRSSISEHERWVSGFSQSNSKTSESETTGQKVAEEVPEAKDCKVDLVFLMDGSWSIGKRRFRIQKLFLNQMAEVLNVGISGPLMGIVQYGDDPHTEFSLRSYFNSKDLKNAIDKIPQKGGYSNVGKALSYINKNYFSDASGNRGAAPNVAVVLVDGWPTDKVEEASRLARESGINIFFVTIEAADDNEKSNVVEPNFVDKAVCRTNGHFSINVPSWFGLHKIVNPLVKRMCDTDKLVCSKTCLNAADIGFVIDGSSSVGTGNFRTVLQFIANITSEFEISDTDTRIGAVQYTYEQRLEFGFDKYSTKQDVVNAIMRIGYWSGGTSTGAAITYASEQLFSKSKPNKRKIMIVITDGRSYDDVRAPAAAAHQSGVIAYAVGVAWAAQDELESMATDPDKDHSFFVDEFDSLYKFVGKIIQNICTEYNSQPRN